MSTVEITADNFEQTILNNDIVILDFWADWCGPCKAFGPTFEKSAGKHPKMVFGKINTEEQQALAAQFGIRSIPTLMVFREKIGVFQQPGALPPAALEDLLTQVEGLDMNDVRAQMAASETAEA
jgi:thioredoxin 1